MNVSGLNQREDFACCCCWGRSLRTNRCRVRLTSAQRAAGGINDLGSDEDNQVTLDAILRLGLEQAPDDGDRA